ncbi:hypothetical protein J6590_061352 [Homalodisca vitripennis]|nr:hypothetical protein J6590_061352 [Homalodisca vitripennis]
MLLFDTWCSSDRLHLRQARHCSHNIRSIHIPVPSTAAPTQAEEVMCDLGAPRGLSLISLFEWSKLHSLTGRISQHSVKTYREGRASHLALSFLGLVITSQPSGLCVPSSRFRLCQIPCLYKTVRSVQCLTAPIALQYAYSGT